MLYVRSMFTVVVCYTQCSDNQPDNARNYHMINSRPQNCRRQEGEKKEGSFLALLEHRSGKGCIPAISTPQHVARTNAEATAIHIE